MDEIRHMNRFNAVVFEIPLDYGEARTLGEAYSESAKLSRPYITKCDISSSKSTSMPKYFRLAWLISRPVTIHEGLHWHDREIFRTRLTCTVARKWKGRFHRYIYSGIYACYILLNQSKRFHMSIQRSSGLWPSKPAIHRLSRATIRWWVVQDLNLVFGSKLVDLSMLWGHSIWRNCQVLRAC